MENDEFIEMALSFPGTVSQPHFHRTAFKIAGKKIFATLDETKQSANIMLTPDEQKAFCVMDTAIYPIPNKWGLKGATTFDLKMIEHGIVLEGLKSAYESVMAK